MYRLHWFAWCGLDTRSLIKINYQRLRFTALVFKWSVFSCLMNLNLYLNFVFHTILNKYDLWEFIWKHHLYLYSTLFFCLCSEKNDLNKQNLRKMPFKIVSTLIAFAWLVQSSMLFTVITLAFDNQFKHESRRLSMLKEHQDCF